ncbi:hypothetical protein ACG2F4_05175 [Halalkalibaculum sp. DA3122]|uniref:hypothetical protein n=1 Tax=Halalkalibaculum sp. DA3122 TaxID=3373607 RepID=UPI00375492E4
MSEKDQITRKIDELNNKVETLTEALQSEHSVSKRWLRTDETCDYLSISSSQLQVLKNKGVVEAVKLGGTNFYDRQAIDQTLTEKFEEVQI